jgi:EAL domain-containing protein (putative c-di-GMP-specific phosphodiesterase class I)
LTEGSGSRHCKTAEAAANARTSALREAFRAVMFLLLPLVGVVQQTVLPVTLAVAVYMSGGESALFFGGLSVALAAFVALILPLGRWVLDAAFAQLAAWADQPGRAQLVIAVNVSARQFRQPDFAEVVTEAIRRTGVAPQRLTLELTESLMVDGFENMAGKMGRLKALGVGLALDDFGMGYSSLSYLQRLPLDQLKIDRAFVKDLLVDESAAAIARTIIALARSLRLDLVAEGVETEAQREFLAQEGCGCFQGYLYCPPLPIAALERYLSGESVPGVPPLPIGPVGPVGPEGLVAEASTQRGAT